MTEEKATDKQIKFATKLGIQKPEVFTKNTLREMIRAKVDEQDEPKNGVVDVEVVRIRDPDIKPEYVGFPVPTKALDKNGTQAQIVRMNAVSNAIQFCETDNSTAGNVENLLKTADEFVRYVENGSS